MLDGHSYDETRKLAQDIANETGLDVGLQKDHFGNFYFHVLPGEKYRFSSDLSCEVVRPETIRKV